MGMDLYVYQLEKALTRAEAAARDEQGYANGVINLRLTEEQLAHIRKDHPAVETEPETLIDMDQVFKAAGLDESWAATGWNFVAPMGWVDVTRTGAAAGEVAEERRVEVPSDQVLIRTGRHCAAFEGKEIGYMRKPFRKRIACSAVQVVEPGESIVLSSGNFDGADMPALVPLLGGQEAVDSCDLLFLNGDISRLKDLQEHCFDTKVWKQVVLDKLTDNVVVSLDW